MKDNYKIQMDNAPYHFSIAMKEYYKEFLIPLMYQPPKSPDLNPIERVWAVMKKRISDRKPKNQNQLKEFILVE